MGKIGKAYREYADFGDYRASVLAASVENDATYKELDYLRLHRKAVLAEIDGKIAKLKAELLEQGLPDSSAKLKRDLENKLRDDRQKVKEVFSNLVLDAFDKGRTVPEIANAEDIRNWNILYSLRREWENGRAADRPTLPDAPQSLEDARWEHSDLTGMHRYAVSTDRQFVRVLGEDDKYSFFKLETGELLDGPDISYNPKKAEAVRKDLDGQWDGPEKRSPNPYVQ